MGSTSLDAEAGSRETTHILLVTFRAIIADPAYRYPLIRKKLRRTLQLSFKLEAGPGFPFLGNRRAGTTRRADLHHVVGRYVWCARTLATCWPG